MPEFLTQLIDYLKSTSLLKQIFSALMLVMITSWLGFVYLIATAPDQFLAVVGHVEHIDVRASNGVSAHIDAELQAILIRTGADRASLNKFHNGKTDITGAHFLYSSRTNETYRNGAAGVTLLNQNLPLSLLSEITPKLLAHSCAVIQAGHSSSEAFYRQQGISASIACPIYHGADLIAFLQLDYVSGEAPSNDKDILQLQASATRIEGILAGSN